MPVKARRNYSHKYLQHQFKNLIERALKACFGADNSRRLIYNGRRLLFGLLYPADYKLSKKQYDVLFACDTVRWQNIKLVVQDLIDKRPDLKLGVAFPGSRDELEDFSNLAGVTTIAHANIYTLYLFDTRILYLPIPDLPRLLSPPNACVVHGLMSIASLDGVYSDHHFDGFDYIVCGGPHHVDSFRRLALRRPILLGTRLLPAGYPKLDLMLDSHSTKQRPTDSSVKSTVVYAPTHTDRANESFATIRHYGEAIISGLLADGHRVIFRPHPLSFADEDRHLIDRICQLHASNPRFSLDKTKHYAQSYSSADLMVTDISGTGFTFSLTFSRPCIFFAPNAEAERGLRGIQFDCRHRIGALVRNIDEMIEKTSELCHADMTSEIERFRGELVFNVGKSASYIVNCLEDILSGRERSEWVRL
jgi:hypothetical protein